MITMYLANRNTFGNTDPELVWHIALIETMVECLGVALLFGLPL